MFPHASSENLATVFFRPWSSWSNCLDQKRELGRALITISALLLSFACYTWLKIARTQRPRLPPGPRGLPLVGYLPFLKPDLHRLFTQLARSYGPIMSFRIGAKLCVVLTSPKLAKKFLKDHDATFANRDAGAAALISTHGGSDIAFNSYCPEWRMLRKVVAQEMMTSATLDAYYELRRREIRQMVRDVHGMVGRPINVADTIFQTMFDIVTSMLWGGTIEEDGRRPIGVEFQHVAQQIVDLLSAPNVSDLFPVMAWLDLQGVVRRMKRLSKWVDRLFDSIIDRRMGLEGVGKKRKSKDFLQLLLQIKDAEDPSMPLTLTHVKALLLDVIAGATDTTSTTIAWTMTKLMENPAIMRKLQKELDEVVGTNDVVEECHLPKLQYVRAVIKETLRIFPVVPFLIPRTPSEPCIVDGYLIPKGARVIVNAWAIHRDPEVWDDPLEFRPERFISTSKKFELNGSDFRYIPFGSGRRVCAGIPMAERMLIHTLASLLHSFKWRLPDGTKLDVTEKFGIVLRKATPLMVVPTPRLRNPDLYT